MTVMTIEPDTKDWTWVLDRPCPECGFDAPGLDRDRIPQAIRDNATLWEVVLDDRRRRGAALAPTCGRRWSTPATSVTSPALRRSGWR